MDLRFQGELVGGFGCTGEVFNLIQKLSFQSFPGLILGETGTGKSLIARAIHASGPRSGQPFVAVDCAGLTPTLFETELFGHVQGAFTGATESRKGLLVAAGKGTVFLDEITELPIELQAKLLSAIQVQEVRPVGSNTATRIHARILAATNQDLEAAVKHGKFREDLYYRLNVLPVRVPPLRETKDSIPALVKHFISVYGTGESVVVSPIAMERIMAYNWPGNVRELENCVQRALVLGSGKLIEAKDLPSALFYATPNRGILPLEDMERSAIMQALEATCGHRLRTAKILGIGKTTIYRKIKKFGLENLKSLPNAS